MGSYCCESKLLHSQLPKTFYRVYFLYTVDQLMFAAINVRVFAKQTSSLLLMFADSCQEG